MTVINRVKKELYHQHC